MIESMQQRRKVRVTVTLSEDVLRRLDERAAREPGASRSSVMESWLREVSYRHAQAKLEADIAAYYEALSDTERVEADDWSRISTASFLRREKRKSR